MAEVSVAKTCVNPGEPPSVARRLRLLLPFAILLALAVTAWALGYTRYLTLANFVAHRNMIAAYVESHWLASLAGMFGLYVIVVSLSLPGGLVLTIMSGFLFGGLFGGALAATAATIGATIIFLIARSSLGRFIATNCGSKVERFASGFRRNAFSYLLFLRLVPVAPFWLVNLAPACLGVHARAFIAATALGILPSTFAFAFLGAGLDAAVMEHEARLANCDGDPHCLKPFAVHDLATPQLFITMLALAGLALLPIVIRAILARRSATG